ncbi:FkbM family methyltransferase [Methanocaldococcus fervens]|uniref:Methyltransferase FkbM family n=1 Tax=Methanocaldococcus fervens (strain DSM 4213 / JCM 15782 / AG86) TaxID=573064 RepID=C7P712_METFA|nr:FkbM family methyltransferase [Methanocaldococcus fervens]ACV24344.1 methyltransferase FkbM family [Methanocaldococcus fervens AG86]
MGANIGVATLYFKTLYPNSKIYAFEPVPETFELLKKNVGNLEGVEIFPYAVGSEGEITISYSEAGDVLSHKNGNLKKNVVVKSISIKKFIEENKINHIDILKLDIEGSEIEVLRDLKDNFNIIDNIVMEWHYSIEDFKNLSKELNLKKYYNIQISNNIIKLTRD